MFILTHPVNFPVGGNRRARGKPTTFGRVLTDSFHMSRALGSSYTEKVLTENRTRNLRGERRAHWPLRHRGPRVLCQSISWSQSPTIHSGAPNPPPPPIPTSLVFATVDCICYPCFPSNVHANLSQMQMRHTTVAMMKSCEKKAIQVTWLKCPVLM